MKVKQHIKQTTIICNIEYCWQLGTIIANVLSEAASFC